MPAPSRELSTSPNFAVVTPSNSADLPAPARGLYVGNTGNVAVYALNGSTEIIWYNVPSGGYVRGQISRVLATNTTATNIIALF